MQERIKQELAEAGLLQVSFNQSLLAFHSLLQSLECQHYCVFCFLIALVSQILTQVLSLSLSHNANTHIHMYTQVPGKPPAREIEWSDIYSTPYFNAVLKESMRLSPVAATGTMR